MPWNDKRPMSPHLQIYKLPITAKLSILHRGTGAILTIGLILLAITLASVASGESAWESMRWVLSSWFGYLVLIGFTASLYYHFCNGIRHLFWDAGKGLDLKSAEKSATIVLIATVALTVFTWVIALI
ncbi:MAG: succinate dehydrogenase, cytochrome b556 subunit [Cocleimonas sp.]|nr:succinate dehydrogenase, cytochrome b556 subunit [Cocleimonas sp.]